jgi:hypothetical protein
MITRTDVLDVAKDLKIETTEAQILFVIRYYECQADADPTGFWKVWVEDLLEEFDSNDVEEKYYGKEIDNVFKYLVTGYEDSEVTSGEFIHSLVIPQKINGEELNEFHVIKGIQAFLEWDGSDETFKVTYDRVKGWISTEYFSPYDSITYDGKDYPVRVFEVVSLDGQIEGTYMIAQECLLDAMDDNGEDVDEEIYHYVEDEALFLSAEEICLKHLDMPFKLIEEII